jgi:hypothetical protein
MGTVWWQDTSKCVCVAPPICPPPGGGNGGDPEAPTICGVVPLPRDDNGGPPPPPPWTGGGGIGPRDYVDPIDPPWPPEPPRITGPTLPDQVYICTGYGNNKKCKPMSASMANQDWPNRVHHATFDDCKRVCINEQPPEPPDPTTGPTTPGGGGGGGGPIYSIWYKCTGYPEFRCYTVVVNQGQEPPPYSHRTRAACEQVCGGPSTPPSSITPKTRWWVCSGHPQYKCTAVLIPTDQPPPQGAHLSQTSCEERCKKPEGPTTPGGGFTSPPTVGGFQDTDGTGTTTGEVTGGEITQGEQTSTDTTNSNLPGVPVVSNPLDPYSGGVNRPTETTNSNIPAAGIPAPPLEEGNIVGLNTEPGANLPRGLTTQDAYNSPAARTTEAFVEFLKFDPSMQVYDVERTLTVQNSLEILKRAEMRTPAFGDPGDILNERIHTVINDVLRSKGGETFVPYNGVTAGAFMYRPSLIKDSLNQGALDALEEVKTQNLFSLKMDGYLLGGIQRAMLAGKLDGYSVDLLKNMSRESKSLWPRGLPQVAPNVEQEAAYNLIRQTRRTLDPHKYKGEGNNQQTVRRMRQVPKDIDLTLPIVARSGQVTGARFQNDDGLPIVTLTGPNAHPKQQNEFFTIVKQDGSKDYVELKSNRNIAYAFDANQKNVIEELLKADTGVLLEFSSTPPSTTDIEVKPPDNAAIPEILIFSSMRETITDVNVETQGIRRTTVNYELGWKPGESEATFDSIVSPYVGPRATFYIPSDDPVWNYLVKPIDAGERAFVTLTFNSLDLPLDGLVYPRQIYTDFALAPTDRIQYDPLQGASRLAVYEEGQNIKRAIKVHPSPFLEIQNESYVKSVRDTKDISGKSTQYGMKWGKNFTSGDYTRRLSSDGSTFRTKLSSFSRLYNVIKRIDDNYDLQDGYHGKRVPVGDVYSFLSFKEFVDTFQIPSEVRFNLFQGVYNNIKVYPVLKDTTEPTYLTSDRLTGTNLNKVQKQTIVPRELPYFDSRYKGKLY